MNENTTPNAGRRRLEMLRDEVPKAVMEFYHRAGEACQKANYAEAHKIARHGVALAISNKSELGQLWCLHILGNALFYLAKLDESKSAHLKVLSMCEKLGFPSGIASSLNNLGLIDQQEGKFHDAQKKFEDSIRIYTELGSERATVVEKHLCDLKNSEEIFQQNASG